LAGITRKFGKLFNSGVEGGDKSFDVGTGFREKYKWLIHVDSLAGGDVLKWDQVFDLPAIEFLNYIMFHVEKSEHERYEINRQTSQLKYR
jgi:hypothetical protein